MSGWAFCMAGNFVRSPCLDRVRLALSFFVPYSFLTDVRSLSRFLCIPFRPSCVFGRVFGALGNRSFLWAVSFDVSFPCPPCFWRVFLGRCGRGLAAVWRPFDGSALVLVPPWGVLAYGSGADAFGLDVPVCGETPLSGIDGAAWASSIPFRVYAGIAFLTAVCAWLAALGDRVLEVA